MSGNDMAYPANQNEQGMTRGLTKHELFAAMVLQGLLSNPEALNGDTLAEAKKTGFTDEQIFSASAARYATALITELNK